MANKATLKPFTKGDKRASEAGKKSKRGKSIKTIIDKIMSLPADKVMDMSKEERDALPLELKDMTAEEMMVYRAAMMAMLGDKDARKYITEYSHGKVKENIEVTERKMITFVEAVKESKDKK